MALRGRYGEYRGQPSDDRFGPVGDLSPGDPDYPISGRQKLRVAQPVALEAARLAYVATGRSVQHREELTGRYEAANLRLLAGAFELTR